MPGLKRSAAVTKSAKSKKLQSRETPLCEGGAGNRIAAPQTEDSDDFLAEAIPLLRAMLLRQMKENKKASSTPVEAMKRSRESATSSGLVRTLERLDALTKSREKRGKKAKLLDGKELRERFIRRMDQLLADEAQANAARKPDGR